MRSISRALPAQSTPAPWEAAEIVANAALRLRFWKCAAGRMDHLARNGDGDELLFIHSGAGELFCDFGHLSFAAGDYILLPRGTLWRIEAAAAARCAADRGDAGKLPSAGEGPGRPARALRRRDARCAASSMRRSSRSSRATRERWQVRIKRRAAISTITYPFNPLDAVGWHGDLAVARINVRDIRPLMSHRYHLPPSAHTTFVAEPLRRLHLRAAARSRSDPGAIKVPFFHNNDDYDEVIFYHAGNFFSRDNIHPGMVTLHPCGFTHGPHPEGARERAAAAEAPPPTKYAVMIDARDPLEIGAAAATVEWAGYVDSWRTDK